MSEGARKWLLHLLRIAVSAACIAITIRIIDWGKFREAVARVDRAMLAWLVPLLAVHVFVLAWRWWTLLRANGFELPYRRVFLLTYVGAFFNQFLPGAIGGDVARMVLTARDEERKAAVAGTVLLDRVVGLAAMIVVATAAVIPLAGHVSLRVPVAIVLGLFLAMSAGYFVYFSRTLRDSAPGRWLKARIPFARQVREVDGVLKSVRGAPRLVGTTMLQSAAAQLSIVLVAIGFSRALGWTVDVLTFLLSEVLIFILTAVPLSMGGWGVQELAYAQLFRMVGVDASEAVALSILLKLSVIAIALPGGVLFALGAHRTEASK